MNYADNADSCRVDFFKPSGKWYATEAVVLVRQGGLLDHEAFALSLELHLRRSDGEHRLGDMTAVCLEPSFGDEVPLMMTVAAAVQIYDRLGS